MLRKHRWIWIVLLIWWAVLLGSLAMGWNLILVRDYQRMLSIARSLAHPNEPRAPWGSLILGSLAYALALAAILFFFVKFLKELRRNQQQSEFLATVSHELKTPIAALDLSSSLLRNPGLTADETERLWESHQTELKRLKLEVETLLEAAQWQSKLPSLAEKPLRLETWLRESFERWRKLLGPGAQLEREGTPLETDVAVDLRALNLITDNLFTNARKYAKDRPHVTIRTRKSFGRWQIEIADRGWGFDPQDSKKIFERFFRGKTPADHAIPGTGLGLYLASSASRAMGLTLKGHSDGVGLGAVFTLEGRGRFPS